MKCMSVYKKVCKKVKRPRVHWYKVLSEIEDLKLSEHFWRLIGNRKIKSFDRAAYLVLKHWFSTTALERYRWLGEPLDISVL